MDRLREIALANLDPRRTELARLLAIGVVRLLTEKESPSSDSSTNSAEIPLDSLENP
jgi:hypothetical protein